MFLRASANAIAENFFYYYDNSDGSNANAFMHSYLSGLLTIWIGEASAKKWTDAHEYGRLDNIGFSADMDFSNNAFGINMALSILSSKKLFSETMLSAYLQNAVANGYLVRENPSLGLIIDGKIDTRELVPTNSDGWRYDEYGNWRGLFYVQKDK